MTEPLRIVVVAPDLAVSDTADEHAVLQAERSRSLRIGWSACCGPPPEQRLAGLQGALQCGTGCGSCLPELKRLVRSSMPDRLAA